MSNQKLESALAELKKFKEVMEPEAYETILNSLVGTLIPGICYYCNKPINNLSGNPNDWGIPLCHKDEPGKVKTHHIGCVSERLLII